MHAIVIKEPGGPEVLEYLEVPMPEPAADEVRVRVYAAGLNRLDLMQRRGQYPAPPGFPQDIPGVEYAGIVDKVGLNAEDFSPGDRVFGLTGGGAYAQYLVVHQATVMRIPENLTFIEAAAVPETFVTAYDAMISQAHLQPGETALINAVGSGVGTAGVQICQAFGAKCIGTARSPEKLQSATDLGLNIGIEVTEPKFAEAVMEWTEDKGVDVVMELAGGDYVPEDIKCLAYEGRIVIVGLLAGTKAQVDLGVVLRKRAMIKGTSMRARPLEEKIAVTEAFASDMVPLFASGIVRPVVDKVFPSRDAARAHALMEKNQTFGKVILEVEQ